MKIDLPDEHRLPDGLLDIPLRIERVLYEAEQPVVYLTRTRQGQTLLAYVASDEGTQQLILVAPATPASIQRLEAGTIGLREALTDTWMWLIKVDHSSSVGEAWTITPSDVPALHLPRPGTPLLPEHRIAFSARAVGDGLRLGHVPCSVIAFVASAARCALKAVLDHAFDANADGRPTDAHRALYDLPVQRLSFSSFEVGLAAPKQDFFANEVLLAAVNDLTRGLAWAENTSDDAPLQASHDAEEAILRAVLALSPPSHGFIASMEVGGEWFSGRRYALTRAVRAKVSKRLRQMKEETIVVLSGRIGEIDDDKFSFILRDLDQQGSERRGTFPEELLEDMRSHYFEENRIEISGVQRAGRLRVTAVVQMPDRTGEAA